MPEITDNRLENLKVSNPYFFTTSYPFVEEFLTKKKNLLLILFLKNQIKIKDLEKNCRQSKENRKLSI